MKKHTPYSSTLLFLLILLQPLKMHAEEISGRILDKDTGKPIAAVNIMVPGTEMGTFSTADGKFRIPYDKQPQQLLFSHIAYEAQFVNVFSDNLGNIELTKRVLDQDEILVSVNRAGESSHAASHSELSAEEIKSLYTVEDVPMILAAAPGIYSYSESGNGTGYSYLNLRGFDQSRIAVMLDNVSLNDNESHQVYWVDHADILSDAEDVQIQRGVGTNLYGASAFGGSINVRTAIAADESQLSINSGWGSYDTEKYRLAYKSGPMLGSSLYLSGRLTSLNSGGYRDHHSSEQRAFFGGAEYNHGNLQNRLRVIIGSERTDLAWWGVDEGSISDRDARTASYEAYTDDFLQQIYSLNTKYLISENLLVSSTAYSVFGSGYYQTGAYIESYGLDPQQTPFDTEAAALENGLLERRWIQNNYSGIIPRISIRNDGVRWDLGSELRYYEGDHFGEILNDPVNDSYTDWQKYRFYRYLSSKFSASFFSRLNLSLNERNRLIVDLQVFMHRWELDQKKIGFATGYRISNDWNFFNPRIGLVHDLTGNIHLYGYWGQSRKEPADASIIDADDIFSEPRNAAAEKLDNYELGLRIHQEKWELNTNFYTMFFDNEQLKSIDVEQSGEYDYETADRTLHQGIELELRWEMIDRLSLSANYSYHNVRFSSGEHKGNHLPNIPLYISNMIFSWQPLSGITANYTLRLLGEQFASNENLHKLPERAVSDLALVYSWNHVNITAKVNNLFDTLYSSYIATWGPESYYWPAATRNFFLALEVKI